MHKNEHVDISFFDDGSIEINGQRFPDISSVPIHWRELVKSLLENEETPTGDESVEIEIIEKKPGMLSHIRINENVYDSIEAVPARYQPIISNLLREKESQTHHGTENNEVSPIVGQDDLSEKWEPESRAPFKTRTSGYSLRLLIAIIIFSVIIMLVMILLS